jgi:2-polyprenyl-3-methyl-5-hydroxy-6-metoxy-1,4-benzoquinol methylase
MKRKQLCQELKRAYLELEGEHYNSVHYRQNRNRYLKMMQAVLPFSASARILDIGVGFCYLATYFKLQGYEVSAVDFFYGDLPKTRCEQNQIPFFSLNIEVDDLPFEEESFDVIILGEVVEHFTYSPLIPLRKIAKALKKDGTLLLSTPNRYRILELMKKLSGTNLAQNLISPPREEPVWHKGKSFYYRHNRLYSMKEIRRLVRQSGFRVLSSGFKNEGICLKENPIKTFLRCVCRPFALVIPGIRDFLLIEAKRKV